MANGFRKQGISILADLTAKSNDARPVFDSIDAYHDKVLRPVASDYARPTKRYRSTPCPPVARGTSGPQSKGVRMPE
ncbi:MAG: hypothetical protein QF570_09490 [Myxococcota bacterium]|jgi:hypothetical protein|nr:hypothetical protein [Myxococcota bacterium]